MRGRGGDEVLRIKVRVADDSHRAGHLGDGFPSHFEKAGPEITSDTVVGSRPFQALIQNRMVESVSAAGMALQH